MTVGVACNSIVVTGHDGSVWCDQVVVAMMGMTLTVPKLMECGIVVTEVHPVMGPYLLIMKQQISMSWDEAYNPVKEC